MNIGKMLDEGLEKMAVCICGLGYCADLCIVQTKLQAIANSGDMYARILNIPTLWAVERSNHHSRSNDKNKKKLPSPKNDMPRFYLRVHRFIIVELTRKTLSTKKM